MQQLRSTATRPRASVLTVEMFKPVFVGAGRDFAKDQAPRLSAALTFYLLLALSPLLIFLITVVGLIQNSDRFRHMLLHSIGFSHNQDDFLRTLLHTAHDTNASVLATLFGIAVAVFGASGLFEQLRDSVNAIWGVNPTSRTVWQMVLGKFSAVLMVLIGGGIIVVWTLFEAWMRYMRHHYAFEYSSVPFWQIVSFFATWVLSTPVFALMFKYLPCKDLKWCDVWLPAILTGLLFAIGKYALGLYLLLGSANASYGAAGSVIIVLLWAYYSTEIFFFGVEISKHYALLYGSHKGEPEDHKNRVLKTGATKVTGS